MKAQIAKRTALPACAVLIMAILSLHIFAVDYSAGAGMNKFPYETALGDGNGGGRLGENYNAPTSNGGGEGNGNGNANGGVNDNGAGMYADTTEDGEVLGVMDTENSATVGIVIAILIAVAVIVLIIALIPRGTSGA